jgi:hypothetical protein
MIDQTLGQVISETIHYSPQILAIFLIIVLIIDLTWIAFEAYKILKTIKLSPIKLNINFKFTRRVH